VAVTECGDAGDPGENGEPGSEAISGDSPPRAEGEIGPGPWPLSLVYGVPGSGEIESCGVGSLDTWPNSEDAVVWVS
jgi:hypothetical protein